jgi:hypothetical protein
MHWHAPSSTTCNATRYGPIGTSATPATIACRWRSSATGCMVAPVCYRSIHLKSTNCHSIFPRYRCHLFASPDRPSVPHQSSVSRQGGRLHTHGPWDSRQLRCSAKVHQFTPPGHQLRLDLGGGKGRPVEPAGNVPGHICHKHNRSQGNTAERLQRALPLLNIVFRPVREHRDESTFEAAQAISGVEPCNHRGTVGDGSSDSRRTNGLGVAARDRCGSSDQRRPALIGRAKQYIHLLLHVSVADKTVGSISKTSNKLPKEVLSVPSPEKASLIHLLHVRHPTRPGRHTHAVPWRAACANAANLAERALAARRATACVGVAQRVVAAEVRAFARLHTNTVLRSSAEEYTNPGAVRRSSTTR